MKTHRWQDVKAKRISPARAKEIRDQVTNEILEMNLAACRQLVGKQQVEVAEALAMNQGPLSAFERRDDHLVSRLRDYVEALGGELEIIARFDDKTVRLKGV